MVASLGNNAGIDGKHKDNITVNIIYIYIYIYIFQVYKATRANLRW